MDRSARARTAVTERAHAIIEASIRTDDDAMTLVLTVLEVVRESVGGDSSGLYRHTYGGMTTALFIDPAALWKAIPAPELPSTTACSIHPGVRHFMHHRATAPFAITDVVSERDWLSSELGSAMRPAWGRNHQLALPLDDATATTRHVWVVGRATTGFTAADRDVAGAMQPILDAITRHYMHVPQAVPDRSSLARLTSREQTIAALLNGNEPNAVIARRLAVSPRTIHKHTERIYRKLDIHDRHALRELLDNHSSHIDPVPTHMD